MTTYEHSFATRTTKQTDYAVLKLINGEEIIAKLVTSSTNDITLSDPVQIHRITSPIGNEMIRCSYWLLFNTCNEVTVQKTHVVFFAQDVSKNTIRHYELFLKHADHGDVDENLGEIMDQAEEQLKKAQAAALHVLEESDENDIEDDIDSPHLIRPAANTIH